MNIIPRAHRAKIWGVVPKGYPSIGAPDALYELDLIHHSGNRRFCPPAAVRLPRVLANDEDETGRPKPAPSGSAHTRSLDGS